MAVHYEDGEVRLLWARPDSGYDVTVLDDGPDKVYVRFRSGGSRSLVSAFYRDGQPAEEVVERGKDDGGTDSRGSQSVRQQSDWDGGDAGRERYQG